MFIRAFRESRYMRGCMRGYDSPLSFTTYLLVALETMIQPKNDLAITSRVV